MRKLVALFSAACVFLWILPLGAFIRPSQEKTACDGKRAFHMCSMGFFSNEQKEPTSQKISFTSGSGVEKTNKSASGSGGNDFADESGFFQIPDKSSKVSEIGFILPNQSFFFVPEPVPKSLIF